MKKYFVFLAAFFIVVVAKGQDFTGQWNGALQLSGTELHLVFHVESTADGFKSTMDSPDQGAFGIPTSTTTVAGTQLTITLAKQKIEYSGNLAVDEITGTFKQNGMSFPMNLKRGTTKTGRPQDPVPPYPYYEENVTFLNKKDNIELAGTLTLPKKEGHFPAVVLITGSGPQDRNEALMGHRPFLVLSDYLTRKGIAVLRVDDRGVGASKGDFNTAVSTDFAKDVEAAVQYLKTRKEIEKNKIGLVGHSEGGMIAPMVAAGTEKIGFIVLLSGPGIRGGDLLLLQKAAVQGAEGISESMIQQGQKLNKGAFDIIYETQDTGKLREKLKRYVAVAIKDAPDEVPSGTSEEECVKMIVKQLTMPWMRDLILYDPTPTLKQVKCPVLALGGSKDLQVPATVNLEAIKKALEKGGNRKVTIKELPGLNHLFQECTTCSPSEYGKIEQTISPIALDEIGNWIINQTR